MKLYILVIALVFGFSTVHAEDSLYHPKSNAAKDIAAAIAKAKKENKHVLIQGGGNWCIWCKRFNAFTTTDPQLDSMIKKNFIVYHLNYSPENKNETVFAKYGYAQRFGFPVFIVLDENGNRLHTQNSAYLEEGKGYSKEKIMGFLKDWSPAALNPANYKKNE
ncbi:MAG: hypothetical protein JWN76_1833 [Chitinophagaceae bacterium]|nr:hypothetical protein [Chitinophagaceae bacterium]